jgi:hypothetical protein
LLLRLLLWAEDHYAYLFVGADCYGAYWVLELGGLLWDLCNGLIMDSNNDGVKGGYIGLVGVSFFVGGIVCEGEGDGAAGEVCFGEIVGGMDGRCYAGVDIWLDKISCDDTSERGLTGSWIFRVLSNTLLESKY